MYEQRQFTRQPQSKKMADDVRHMLKSVGLDSLWQNFEREKIDSLDLCKGLQDRELTNLGLVTIGDKVRFRSFLQETAKSTIPSEQSVETRNQARIGRAINLYCYIYIYYILLILI